METQFSLPVALGIVFGIIGAGTAGLMTAPIGMTTNTILMMVLPSMVVFAAIVFVIGVMHGQYRATNA
jgi:hypothetical protein